MMLLASLALVLGVITVDCYNIGLGRADVTGPAAEIGMMGYAKQGQNTGGGSLVLLFAMQWLRFVIVPLFVTKESRG